MDCCIIADNYPENTNQHVIISSFTLFLLSDLSEAARPGPEYVPTQVTLNL